MDQIRHIIVVYFLIPAYQSALPSAITMSERRKRISSQNIAVIPEKWQWPKQEAHQEIK